MGGKKVPLVFLRGFHFKFLLLEQKFVGAYSLHFVVFWEGPTMMLIY